MKRVTGIVLCLAMPGLLCAGCGSSSTPEGVSTRRAEAAAAPKQLERSLPPEVKLYWAKPISSYSLSPDEAVFSYAKSYPKQVTVFDAALPAQNKDRVKHARTLDAVAVVYNHYFHYYDGRPPTPLVWWLQYKLGDPSWGVMYDAHIESTAEGQGADVELDKVLEKAAREFDPKEGLWSYGVAREEYEPGKFRQTVLFAEIRLQLEDFPKSYSKGAPFRLKGRVIGQQKDLTLTMSIDGDYFLLDKELDIDSEGNFSLETALPNRSGTVTVSIGRNDEKDMHGGRLFLDIYVDTPEPASPTEGELYWEGLPEKQPLLECASFKPRTSPTAQATLPELPTYEQMEASLDQVRAQIKLCNGDEGGESYVWLMIDGSGQVKSADVGVDPNDPNSKPLGLCVATALCEAKFPEFKSPLLKYSRRLEL